MLLLVPVLEDIEHSLFPRCRVYVCMCAHVWLYFWRRNLCCPSVFSFSFQKSECFSFSPCILFSAAFITCAGSFWTKRSTCLDKSFMVRPELSEGKKASSFPGAGLPVMYPSRPFCFLSHILITIPTLNYFLSYFFISALSFKVSSIVFTCYHYAAFAPWFGGFCGALWVFNIHVPR